MPLKLRGRCRSDEEPTTESQAEERVPGWVALDWLGASVEMWGLECVGTPVAWG